MKWKSTELMQNVPVTLNRLAKNGHFSVYSKKKQKNQKTRQSQNIHIISSFLILLKGQSSPFTCSISSMTVSWLWPPAISPSISTSVTSIFSRVTTLSSSVFSPTISIISFLTTFWFSPTIAGWRWPWSWPKISNHG